MVKAVFPGSFDPPTFGHLNIIERARTIFNEVHVVVAVNSEKKYLFSEAERVAMISEMVKGWDNVFVHSWNSLIVSYAKQIGAQVLIRGVRNLSDFSYEFDLAMMNRGLNPDIETVFLSTDPEFFVLRSSAIKELAAFGGDVSSMVPEPVAKALHDKFSKNVR
jgi:pantetheine-phosphate adenylyltransferase